MAYSADHTVNDITLSAINYGNLYARHCEMARMNYGPIELWIDHVHTLVIPQWRKEGGRAPVNVGQRREIAGLLRSYYIEHVNEG